MFTRDSKILSHRLTTPLTSVANAVGDVFKPITFSYLIKSLFANNEQGFAYDPNDLTIMFQDASGTIPVTAQGQPVGLMLDKSKGVALGSTNHWELPPTKLDANWVDNGNGMFTSDGRNGSVGLTSAGVQAGRFYEWTFEIISYTSGQVRPQNSSGIGYAYAGGVGVYVQKALCTASALYMYSSAFIGTIRVLSVRELAGNHAYQNTSSMRPLLVASPQRLDFDTVDDKLTTTLPAQLTGCTVVRAVPNVGTQILMNQTIPTPYNDNTDHCGLIVINRALTATETSQITKLFNKAAGV